MSNEELLLAISKLLDEKLDEKLSPIGQNLNQIDEQIEGVKFSVSMGKNLL